MKKILLAVAVLIAACSQGHTRGMDVTEVLTSSITVHVVAVSSHTDTGATNQVDGTSTVLLGRLVLTLQNLDTANKVYCSQKSNVTTSTGFMLPENGGSISLPLGMGTPSARVTLYCITAKTTGASNVAVIQGY